MAEDPLRDYLSVDEFVQRTGISHATVRRRLKDGTLEKIQPGGPRTRVLIPVDALDRFRQGSICQLTSEMVSVSTPQFNETVQTSTANSLSANKLSGPSPKWKQLGRRSI